MKKLVLFAIILFFILNIKIFNLKFLFNYNFSNNANVEVAYSDVINNLQYVKNNNTYLYSIKFNDINNYNLNLNKIMGVTIKLSSKGFNIDDFIKYFNAKVVVKTVKNNIKEYLIYSKLLPGENKINNTCFNLQIVDTAGIVNVGWPALLQSY